MARTGSYPYAGEGPEPGVVATHEYDPAEDSTAEAWHQKWWVWTLIGVGAAAIAGGVTTAVVLSTQEDSGGPSFSATVSW